MNDLAKVIPWEVDSIEDSIGAPWTELVEEDYHVMIFRDMYPKYNTIAVMNDAVASAIRHGERKLLDGEWDGFNIGMNVGEAAGQTCTWPHVHLIPRRKGDMPDPTGGVRHVIPEKGNYRK